MSKYLKLFETTSDYEAYINGGGVVLPNVSVAKDAPTTVYYKPKETKLVVYYDIQDISSPTTIFTNFENSIKSIEIDGTLLDNVVTTYQFDSVGEHVIKYEFNNPTTVGNNAPLFMGVTTIKRVVIADTFTGIGDNAFNGCLGLTSITIPYSVTSIGDYAFYSCSGLTSIVVDSANTVYDSRDNCNAIINTSTNELIAGCKNTIIPSSVTSIGYNAFHGSGLTSITIPDSVTSIGSGAFSDCRSLTSIVSNAVTAPSIQSNTFENVNTGGTLHVPAGNTGYDVWMQNANYYLGLYGWRMVPMNIITYEASEKLAETTNPFGGGLHTNAFSGTNGKLAMTSHIFENGVGTIEFDGDVTEIGWNAFYQCTGLTSVTIGNSVTSIGAAFYGCSSLTSITIPSSVTSIGQSAFGGCSGLTSITIGNSVTSIGERAFYNCSSLTSITSLAMTAPTIGSQTFQDVHTNGTLTVPSGSTGYDVWMGTGNYYLGKYGWTKVEQ